MRTIPEYYCGAAKTARGSLAGLAKAQAGSAPLLSILWAMQNRQHRLYWTLGLALLALALAFGIRSWFAPRLAPASAETPALPPPERIYGAEFDDEDGRIVALAHWKGKLLLLNFWATWCVPCVSEMPALQKAQDELGEGQVSIVGIGAEESRAIKPFRIAHGLRFPLLAGSFESLRAAQALGDRKAELPFTVLVSPDGHVLRSHVGALPDGEVQRWVAEATRHANP